MRENISVLGRKTGGLSPSLFALSSILFTVVVLVEILKTHSYAQSILVEDRITLKTMGESGDMDQKGMPLLNTWMRKDLSL